MTVKRSCYARLLLLGLLAAFANGAEAQLFASDRQSHSTSYQAQSLKEVLAFVGKTYNVSFVYLEATIEDKTIPHFKLGKQRNLDEDLARLLKHTELTYSRISDNQIAIVPQAQEQKDRKEETPKKELRHPEQRLLKADPIRGRIVTNENAPVEGVTVTVKGKNRSTVANANGEFEIDAGNLSF